MQWCKMLTRLSVSVSQTEFMFIFRFFGFFRPRMRPTLVNGGQDRGRGERRRRSVAVAGGHTGGLPVKCAHIQGLWPSAALCAVYCGFSWTKWPAERGICLWCRGDSLFSSPSAPRHSLTVISVEAPSSRRAGSYQPLTVSPSKKNSSQTKKKEKEVNYWIGINHTGSVLRWQNHFNDTGHS